MINYATHNGNLHCFNIKNLISNFIGWFFLSLYVYMQFSETSLWRLFKLYLFWHIFHIFILFNFIGLICCFSLAVKMFSNFWWLLFILLLLLLLLSSLNFISVLICYGLFPDVVWNRMKATSTKYVPGLFLLHMSSSFPFGYN